MSTASLTARLPRDQILAETQSAFRLQQSVLRSLDMLLKLSHAQLDSLDGNAWEQILQRKQLLLDELEKLKIGIIVNQARQLAEKLVDCEQWEFAENMRENIRIIREKFLALAEREHSTQQYLQQRVAALRTTLCERQQHQQAQAAYEGPASEVPSRFLNGLR